MLDIKVGDIPKLLKPQYLIVVAIATGLVLFLPLAVIERLGLDELQGVVRPWFGVAFILAVTLLATHGISALWRSVVAKRKHEANRKLRHQQLHNLTVEEQNTLSRYIAAGTKTQELVINSGVVTGLMSKGILRLASQIGHQNMWVSPTAWFGQVNINDWAWDYLHQNHTSSGLRSTNYPVRHNQPLHTDGERHRLACLAAGANYATLNPRIALRR